MGKYVGPWDHFLWVWMNTYPKMGTYVAVLGWLSNIKNHIRSICIYISWLKSTFHSSDLPYFFLEGFLLHVLVTTLKSPLRLCACPCEQHGLEFCFSFEYLSAWPNYVKTVLYNCLKIGSFVFVGFKLKRAQIDAFKEKEGLTVKCR